MSVERQRKQLRRLAERLAKRQVLDADLGDACLEVAALLIADAQRGGTPWRWDKSGAVLLIENKAMKIAIYPGDTLET